MGLIEHAKTELEMSGLFNEDKKQLDEVAEYFDGIKRK